jgi:tetratricopeptide (TPR) repeat protein
MRLAVALLVLGLGASAHGDETLAKVRKLYDSGMTHYNLGEYKDALADFKEAYRLRHDPAFLFNIGQAHRQLGEPEDAAREYRAYLREAPDTPNRKEVEKFINDADSAVAARHAAQPPTGVVQPASVPPATTPTTTPAVSTEKSAASSEPPPPKSKTWLWVTIGVVVAVVAIGLGVGLGVGLSQGPSDPSTRFGTLAVFK